MHYAYFKIASKHQFASFFSKNIDSERNVEEAVEFDSQSRHHHQKWKIRSVFWYAPLFTKNVPSHICDTSRTQLLQFVTFTEFRMRIVKRGIKRLF